MTSHRSERVPRAPKGYMEESICGGTGVVATLIFDDDRFEDRWCSGCRDCRKVARRAKKVRRA